MHDILSTEKPSPAPSGKPVAATTACSPPIDGMTLMPFGVANDPIMGGAFIACAMAAIREDSCMDAFKDETGHDMESLLHQTPINRMIDQATGREKIVIGAFFDWIAETVWGLEENNLLC